MAKERNPLEPIASAAYMLFWFAAILVGIASIAALLGADTNVFQVGKTICAVDASAVPNLSPSLEDARPGITLVADGVRFCDSSVDAGQIAWQLIAQVPGFAFIMTAFFLVWRLTVRASKEGIYASAVVAKIRFLGWWLVAGAVAFPAIASVGTLRLLATMEDDPSWRFPDISLAVLLTGLGLITFARIMRIGVRMSEDLEGTV